MITMADPYPTASLLPCQGAGRSGGGGTASAGFARLSAWISSVQVGRSGNGEPDRLSKTYGYALGRHSRESEGAGGGGGLTFTAPADEGNSGGLHQRWQGYWSDHGSVSGQAGYAAPSVAARFVLEGWGIILDGSRRSLPQGKAGEVQNKSAELLRTARLQSEGKDFKGAWRLTQQALEVDPTPETFRLQNQVAMAWLRNLVREVGPRRNLYRGGGSGTARLLSGCDQQ